MTRQVTTIYDSEDWIAPTLLNSWVNYDTGFHEQAGYYKDQFGRVHLKGLVKDGVIDSSIPVFQLPVGYRPSGILWQSTVASAGFGAFNVTADGYVGIGIGSNAWVSLNFSFRASQ